MKHPSGVRCYSCYYQGLPFPWLLSRLWEDCGLTLCLLWGHPRISEGAESWHGWLVRRLLLWVFLHGDLDLTRLSSFLSPHPLPQGYLVSWWWCLSHQYRLCHSIPSVLWDSDYVCSPLTPFSKKDLHLHHLCESRAFFWHIVHGPAYQQTIHRRLITTTLGLEKNYLLHLFRASPVRGSGTLALVLNKSLRSTSGLFLLGQARKPCIG